jgi:hypothetical protein
MTRPPIFIPDVHGQSETLKRLLDTLETEGLLDTHQLVFLGDYIDSARSLQIPALLDQLIELQRNGAVCISGNHDLALSALTTPGVHLERAPGAKDNWYERWQRYTGIENTLAAYGINWRQLPPQAEALPEFFRARIPAEHLDFLRTLPLYWEQDQWIAVHAGVFPENPLPKPFVGADGKVKEIKHQPWSEQRAALNQMQADFDLRVAGWGPSQVCQRELTTLAKGLDLEWEQLKDYLPADKRVVSGHEVQDSGEPCISERRILLDLDAYGDKCLAAWISDQQRLVRQPVVRT